MALLLPSLATVSYNWQVHRVIVGYFQRLKVIHYFMLVIAWGSDLNHQNVIGHFVYMYHCKNLFWGTILKLGYNMESSLNYQ